MIVLARSHFEEIVDHALEQPHQEVCGVLGGRANRVECTFRARNVSETPPTRFEMDSRDIFSALKAIEGAGMDLIGFYHSHTHTKAYPSPTDVAMWSATWGSEALCFICSLMEEASPVLRAFRIDESGQILEEPIVIRDA